MIIKTSDLKSIKPFINQLYFPPANSHKGQNGRVLIIGGSSLFHSAAIWAAEVASHIVDIVHYSSIKENNEIFLSLKKKFRNGIVVSQKNILHYIEEDDSILIGPGMLREKGIKSKELGSKNFTEIINIKDEAEYVYYLTNYLISNYPNKRFVFDAGALQIMERKWLLKLTEKPILTPHQKEFDQLFDQSITQKPLRKKIEIVQQIAKKYRCIILLKAVIDIVTDGDEAILVKGGNSGLTKGGTGDVLAGLTLSFYAKNSPLNAAVLSSYLLKKTADELFFIKGYWYNINDIINNIFITLHKITNKLK